MSKWTDDARRAIRYSVTGREDGTGPMGDALCDRILDLEAELAAMRPVVEAAERMRDSYNDAKSAVFMDSATHVLRSVDAYRAQREGK